MSVDDVCVKKEDVVIDNILEYLRTQVIDDEKIVQTILATGFSTYTANPLNLMIKAPYSEGKSHAATQVMKLFPREDVLFLGGMSPTALVHEQGTLVDENGDSVEDKLEVITNKISSCKAIQEKESLKKEMNETLRKSKNLVNLDGKILVFLDTPNWELWQKLKPILSHDRPEIEFKVTDKKNNALHTKSTLIRGWPAVICCSAKNEDRYKDWDEIRSRFLIASPNTNISKYEKVNQHTALKYGTPGFAKKLHNDTDKESMAVWQINEVINRLKHFVDAECCFSPFNEIIAQSLPSNEGVTMRTTEKFFSLYSLMAQINSENRCKLVNEEYHSIEYVISDVKDIEYATKLLDNPGTLSPDKSRFVTKIFKPAVSESIDGYTTTTKLAEKYEKILTKPIKPKQILENYLKSLESLGIVEWIEDPNDRRTHRYKLAGEYKEITLNELKSKVIEYSKNNPSYVETYLQKLVDHSSSKRLYVDAKGQLLNYPLEVAQLRIDDPEGNIMPIENLQSFLLSETGASTNIIPVYQC